MGGTQIYDDLLLLYPKPLPWRFYLSGFDPKPLRGHSHLKDYQRVSCGVRQQNCTLSDEWTDPLAKLLAIDPWTNHRNQPHSTQLCSYASVRCVRMSSTVS